MGKVVKLKGVDLYSLRRRKRRHRMIKIARAVMIIAIVIVIIAGLIAPFSLKEKNGTYIRYAFLWCNRFRWTYIIKLHYKKAKKREINKNFTNRKNSWWSICKVKKQGE